MKITDLTDEDVRILAVVLGLTLLALVGIVLLAALTPWHITVWPVAMVIGWFFGGIITFGYSKYKKVV